MLEPQPTAQIDGVLSIKTFFLGFLRFVSYEKDYLLHSTEAFLRTLELRTFKEFLLNWLRIIK